MVSSNCGRFERKLNEQVRLLNKKRVKTRTTLGIHVLRKFGFFVVPQDKRYISQMVLAIASCLSLVPLFDFPSKH